MTIKKEHMNEIHIRYQYVEVDFIRTICKTLMNGGLILLLVFSLITNNFVISTKAGEYKEPTYEVGTFIETEKFDNYMLEYPIAGFCKIYDDYIEHRNEGEREQETEPIEQMDENKWRYIANDYEFSILCQIVEAEVTGMLEWLPYEEAKLCKMRVAQVILNRVEDDRFPDTIEDVVFQNAAFSPLLDGRYYEVTPCDMTREACAAVLLNETEDYVYGALYFSSNTNYCEYGYPIFTDPVNHTYFYPYQ